MPDATCFISSTILDLADTRSFLSYELSSYGFRMLLSEEGTIPVDSSKHSYDLCLAAARKCDYLIAIIDGRFGGEIKDTGKSITLAEIEEALDHDKRVFTFVRQGVWDAKEILRPFLSAGVKFRPSKIVSDSRVFTVIDAIKKRLTGNWIFTFNKPTEILEVLAEQIDFPLRTTTDPVLDKLDHILARRFLQEFQEELMERFVYGIQVEYIQIDDTESFDDAVSAFLPQTMRFGGRQSSALFNDFMHKAAQLNGDLPLVFGPSRKEDFYTSRMPLDQQIFSDRAVKLQEVVALAVETHRAWRKFIDFIRGRWPELILELHEPEES